MDRAEMLKELTTLDFIATDMALYLDTHPDNAAAIAEYNRIAEAASLLRNKYEAEFGPMNSYRSQGTNDRVWNWTDEPWPWQGSFNFSYEEEACK